MTTVEERWRGEICISVYLLDTYARAGAELAGFVAIRGNPSSTRPSTQFEIARAMLRRIDVRRLIEGRRVLS